MTFTKQQRDEFMRQRAEKRAAAQSQNKPLINFNFNNKPKQQPAPAKQVSASVPKQNAKPNAQYMSPINAKPKPKAYIGEGVKPTETNLSMRELYQKRYNTIHDKNLTHEQRINELNNITGQIQFREQNPLKEDLFGKTNFEAEKQKMHDSINKIKSNKNLSKEDKSKAIRSAVKLYTDKIDEDAKNDVRTEALANINKAEAGREKHPYLSIVNDMVNPYRAGAQRRWEHELETGNTGNKEFMGLTTGFANDEGKTDWNATTIAGLDMASKMLTDASMLAAPVAKGIGAVEALGQKAITAGSNAINKAQAAFNAGKALTPASGTASLNMAQKVIGANPQLAQNVLNTMVNSAKNSVYGAINMANLGITGGISDLTRGATAKDYASGVGRMGLLGGAAGLIGTPITSNLLNSNPLLKSVTTPVVDTALFAGTDLILDKLQGNNDSTFGEKFMEVSPFMIPGLLKAGAMTKPGKALTDRIIPKPNYDMQNEKAANMFASVMNSFGELAPEGTHVRQLQDAKLAAANAALPFDKQLSANDVTQIQEADKLSPEFQNRVRDYFWNMQGKMKEGINPDVAKNNLASEINIPFKDMSRIDKKFKIRREYQKAPGAEVDDMPDWMKEDLVAPDSDIKPVKNETDINTHKDDKTLVNEPPVTAENKNYNKENKTKVSNSKVKSGKDLIPDNTQTIPKPDIKKLKIVEKEKTIKKVDKIINAKHDYFGNRVIKLNSGKAEGSTTEGTGRSTGELDVKPIESDVRDQGLTIKDVKNEYPEYVTEDADFIKFYDEYKKADETNKQKLLAEKLKSLNKENQFDFYEKFTEQEQLDLNKAKREYDQKYIDANNSGKGIMNLKKPKTDKVNIMPETERLINTAKDNNIEFKNEYSEASSSEIKEGEKLIHNILPSKFKGGSKLAKTDIEGLSKLFQGKGQYEYNKLMKTIHLSSKSGKVKQEAIRILNEVADAYNSKNSKKQINTRSAKAEATGILRLNEILNKIEKAKENNDWQKVRDILKINDSFLENNKLKGSKEIREIYNDIANNIENEIKEKINEGDIEGAKSLFNRTEKILENYYTLFNNSKEKVNIKDIRTNQGIEWKAEKTGDTFDIKQSGLIDTKSEWKKKKSEYENLFKSEKSLELIPGVDREKQIVSGIKTLNLKELNKSINNGIYGKDIINILPKEIVPFIRLYAKDYKFVNFEPKNYSTNGEHNADNKTISLNLKAIGNNPYKFVKTLMHEVCHASQFNHEIELLNKKKTQGYLNKDEELFLAKRKESIDANKYLDDFFNKNTELLTDVIKKTKNMTEDEYNKYIDNLGETEYIVIKNYEKAFDNYYNSFMEIEARQWEKSHAEGYRNEEINQKRTLLDIILGNSKWLNRAATRNSDRRDSGWGVKEASVSPTKRISEKESSSSREQGTVEEKYKDHFSSAPTKTFKELWDDYNKTSSYADYVDDLINTEAREYAKELRALSKETERLKVELGLVSSEQAEARKKMLNSDVYAPMHHNPTKEELKLQQRNKKGKKKDTLYGRSSKGQKESVTGRDIPINLIKDYVKTKTIHNVIKSVKELAIPIERNYDKNNYTAVNFDLLAEVLARGGSREMYEAIAGGKESIAKAFRNENKDFTSALMELHERSKKDTHAIPNNIFNELFNGKDESIAEFIDRYGKDLDKKSRKVKLNGKGQLATAEYLVDAYTDLFKRGVLATPTFVVNNRVSNHLLLAANAKHPIQYLYSLVKGATLKKSDIPPKLLSSSLYTEIMNYEHGNKKSGIKPLDDFVGLFHGDLIETKDLKQIIDSYNEETGKTSKIVNPSYKAHKLWGARAKNLVIGLPNKAYEKIAKKMHKLNDFFEDWEHKAAYIQEIDKAKRDIIQKTGQQIISTNEALKYVKEHPEIESVLVRNVENCLGNYNSFSPIEKRVFKRIVPFYSWFRVVARNTVHLAKNNPTRYALILHEMARLIDDDNELKEYQKGSIRTGLTDPRKGYKLLLNFTRQVPWTLLREFNEGSGFWGNINPVATSVYEAARGRKIFMNSPINSKRYATSDWGKTYYDSKTGKKLDKLPASARANYWLKNNVLNTIYPMARNNALRGLPEGLHSVLTKGKWETPDVYYDDTVGGYRAGEVRGKLTPKMSEYKYPVSETTKNLKRLGLPLQPQKKLNKKEAKIKRQQEAMKKKKKR